MMKYMFIQLVDLEFKWCVVLSFFKELPYILIGVYDENSFYVLGSSKTRDATQSHEIWNDVKISIGLTFVTLMINLLTITLS